MNKPDIAAKLKQQTMPNIRFAELMTAVLERKKLFRFQANGFSMCPFIQDGDVITVSPILANIYQGDVVVVLNLEKHLFVHRVINVQPNGYWIKGDNIQEPDGLMTQSEILGVVTRVEHHGKCVHLGLGSERIIIALLSSRNLLQPVLRAFHWFYHQILERLYL